MTGQINLISIVIGIILMGLSFVGGCTYHKKTFHCPTIVTNTVVVTDPYWHHVADSLAGLPSKEKIKWLPQDTVYVPGTTELIKVDTAVILKDYFSVYKYKWDKQTDTLDVSLFTTVTQNKPVAYDLSYKVKIPFTTTINTVDNTVTYSKYLYGGVRVPLTKTPFNTACVEALYCFPKGYIGSDYEPLTNTFAIKGGIRLIQFKTKK